MSGLTRFESEVVRHVRSLAKAWPDRVYKTRSGACLYGPDIDNPAGCIVGCAVRRAGRPLDAHDGSIASKGHHVGLNNSDVVDWLERVQLRQDGGLCWVEAVALADSRFPLGEGVAA